MNVRSRPDDVRCQRRQSPMPSSRRSRPPPAPKARVERSDIGVVAAAPRPERSRSKVCDARTSPLRSLSIRTNSSTSARSPPSTRDLEGADLDDDLIVDRQPLARLADAAELPERWKVSASRACTTFGSRSAHCAPLRYWMTPGAGLMTMFWPSSAFSADGSAIRIWRTLAAARHRSASAPTAHRCRAASGRRRAARSPASSDRQAQAATTATPGSQNLRPRDRLR